MMVSPSPASGLTESKVWRLRCIHAEGISQEDLQAMPLDKREFQFANGINPIGRHHQPLHFEAWLPDPEFRYCISRSHVQVDVKATGLTVTNLSTNQLCVERVPLQKGESRTLYNEQVLSFAKQENGGEVHHFLILQVRCGDGAVMSASGLQNQPRARIMSPSKAMKSSTSRSPNKRRTTIVQGSLADGEIVRTTARAQTIPASQFPAVPMSPRERRAAAANGEQPQVHSPTKLASRFGATQVAEHPSLLRNTSADLQPALKTQVARVSPLTGLSPSRGRDRSPLLERPSTTAAAALGTRSSNASAPPRIMLEVELTRGTGMRDVPPVRHIVGPLLLDRAAIFGPRYQPEFYEQAFGKEWVQSQNAPHHSQRGWFCIAFESNKTYALSMIDRVGITVESKAAQAHSNNMWQLQDGDVIVVDEGLISEGACGQSRWTIKVLDQTKEEEPQTTGEATPWWASGRSAGCTAAGAAARSLT
mmetsp:Transcript_45713/g.116201  ORF Transcript_45713/g.116201 Transcript_45713/m.116201 type:complete len:477 (-) Transcript_45713:218-1648(-)